MNEFTELVCRYKCTREPVILKRIEEILRDYSERDECLPALVDSPDCYLPMTIKNEQFHILIYTEDKEIKTHEYDYRDIKMNRLIGFLMKQTLVKTGSSGFNFNPDTDYLKISAKLLMKCAFGGLEPYPAQKHDWGKGIPAYTKEDLMDEREVLDYCLSVYSNDLKGSDNEFVFVTNEWNACPNMITKSRKGEVKFYFVQSTVYPEQPKVSNETRTRLLTRAKQFYINGDCFVVPIQLSSKDPKRKEKSLALRGDDFTMEILSTEPMA